MFQEEDSFWIKDPFTQQKGFTNSFLKVYLFLLLYNSK